VCFALFVWFARAALLAGITKTATGKACNECKTSGQLGLLYVDMLGHNVVFQTVTFLRNKKGLQALTAKPATAFPEVVCVTVILSYVFVSKYSLNRLNL